MLRDANHQQAAQQFSFIESLSLSQSDRHDGQTFKTSSQSNSAIVASESTATIDTNWYQLSDDYSLNLSEILKDTVVTPPANEYKPKRNYLGKILFALSCSYGAFVLWWVFGHEGSKILAMVTGGKHITVSKSDLEFIDYMERSLDTIDRQLEANTADVDEELVYVPVYTPNAAPEPQISSSTLPTIPQPNIPLQSLKIPAPPPLPEPTQPAPTPEAAKPTKPAIKHTLTGILELGGDKSAALIKVDGQTRRFWLGEKIGSSGWTLESITNQTAKISDGAEVRTIAVGETF